MGKVTPDWKKVAAWTVHLYTSSGALLGFYALLFTANHQVRATFLAMGLATFIDSTDGTLARMCKVSEVLPDFDGTLLDNIVDYLTYVVAPAFAMLQFGLLPDGMIGELVALFVLLSSAYGFCRREAKTQDHYFLGFPSYWNVVALYMFCLRLSRALNATVLIALGLMEFTRLKFIYPSRTLPLRKVTVLLTGIWGILIFWILTTLPKPSSILVYCSLAFVLYYFLASIFLQIGLRSRKLSSELLS